MAGLGGCMSSVFGAARRALQRYKAGRQQGPAAKAQEAVVVAQRRERRAEKAFFASSEDLKDRVKRHLQVKAYDVHDYYHTTGISQRIARSHNFEHFTLFMVAMNSIWIGVDMDFNRCPVLAMSHPVFRIAEEVFTFFFVFEWVVRFKAFKKKRKALTDAWFVFDSVLCFFMVMENWVLEVVLHLPGMEIVGNSGLLVAARLLRLLRIARMARLFQAMPELLILVRGMAAATRSVGTTLTLLFIMLYIYGLLFRSLTMTIPALSGAYFGSVPCSMYTLVIRGIFMDNLGEFASILGRHSFTVALLFWGFVLTSSLTVMNMLIAVICEAVNSVAATEKEAIQVNMVRRTLSELLEQVEQHDSKEGRISETEFLLLLQNPEATLLMKEVGVDPIALVDHADAMFVSEDLESGSSEQSLCFEEFAQLILSLRSSCRATVKDIIDLRKFTRTIVAQTNDHLSRIEAKLDRVHLGDGRLALAAGPQPGAPGGGAAGGKEEEPSSQKAEELSSQKADMVASMLARAQALGRRLNDTRSAGADVTSLASRAKELQKLRSACNVLKGSAKEVTEPDR